MSATRRVTFGGRLSAVLVTAGSAVGLGNIWRFPYVAGENGGGAFLLIYVLSVLLVGLPIMLAEFSIGRYTRANAAGAYRKLSKGWSILSYICILAPYLILGFYFVVSGWTLEYLFHSATGELAKLQTPTQYQTIFDAYTLSAWRPLLYTILFTLLTHVVIAMGVQKGIERSARILMPLLVVILVVLSIHAMLLPGGMQGVKYLFAPDFSKVSASTVLAALGQAFFSLSVGMGCLVTYGSYFKEETNISRTAVQVIAIDTIVALLAGLAIFPAVFSVGIEPSSGPSLVFVTLPAIFNSMSYSVVWSTIFFLLLVIAALTSTISLHEVLTAYIHEEWHVSRNVAAWITSVACILLGCVASLSLGVWPWLKLFGESVFYWLDFLTADILLPAGGLFVSIYTGWVLSPKILQGELHLDVKLHPIAWAILRMLLRWFCPIAILCIFLNNLHWL